MTLDIGIDFIMRITFFVLLFIFVIYSVFLAYHWFTYGNSERFTRIALGCYLAGSTFCFLIMGSLLI